MTEAGRPLAGVRLLDLTRLPPGAPVFKVPDNLADEVVAPVNCAMGTVTQGLISTGAGEGQNIVIQGAGGLGLVGAASPTTG